ncbi:type II toxin-antitoxin system RelE family toxin [Arthrobacter bambusae]|uniref:type II toxin-antitoxin system RelE family toxin n=1 Tax=Arthrobacter bambusae TaxID=1338426 RepID=UPI001F511A35|nr:type II toxin-antitoxin system RelE/ParE family toxin [Arthrobacter bambusae]
MVAFITHARRRGNPGPVGPCRRALPCRSRRPPSRSCANSRPTPIGGSRPPSSPRPPGAKKFSGISGDWRVRTGDYRIIYEIRDAQLIVLVAALGHHRDIYQH